MASIDNTSSSNLTTKLSPLIEGQVPDFVQADHPLFVKFLKNYYEYLEAGELRVTVDIDDLLLETESTSYALDVDGNHIVLEDGTGTTGKFVVNETITGSTTKATAKVLVDDLGNATKPRLFISSQQKFETGETITGGTSGSTGTVTRYRANPVQNIQQLLEYADTDNTIYDFLDQLRDSFMNAIPTELASGVNKRNLIKNIRELYRAKGTSEGHKIFIRMLLGENADVFYPNKYMLRPSDGKWTYQTILRCSAGVNSVASEVIGKTLTGDSSGASAIIANATTTSEGGDSIVIFEIDPASLSGTFTDGETATAVSSEQDVSMSFTIRGMVTNTTVSDGGILYSAEDSIELDTNSAVGNAEAITKVEAIKTGSVSDVIIDDAGTLYEVGDTLTFSTGQANTKAAEGFVSVIDGSLIMNGTDSSSTNDGDDLLLEGETTSHLEFFNCTLDGTDEERTNADSNLILNGTDGSSTNAGHNLSMEYGVSQSTPDGYGTTSDTFAFEEGTDSTGEITRVFLKDGGAGYSSLPTITVASTTGTGATLLSTTTDIGAVDSIKITNQGFKYVAAPDMTFRANFLLKDVTGTFANGNTLTTHTGTVKDYNSTTQVLETTIEDVVRSLLETGDEEEIALEDSLKISTDVKDTTVGINNSADEGDQIVDASGNRIVLNAHHTVDEYIILEDDTGETAGSAIVVETGDPYGTQLQRFLTESSRGTSAQLSGAGDTLVTNSAIDDSPSTIVLDGTDGSSTNAGGDILNEEYGNNNTIILNGTDSDSTNAGAKLLHSIETASGNISLDGTDSSSTNAGDNIVNQSSIDFSGGTTTVTDSSGATATIVAADIAKGTTTIGTAAETTPSYGTSVESLISEDLIRIQDSYFYQAFSYEVQTDSSSVEYLRPLKKAVHPAGFAVFGKVSAATAVSMAISTTGSSLGGEYTADTDTFSPILASTFEVLFDEVMQRRLGASAAGVGELEQVILLEDDETIGDGFSIQLNGTDSSSTNAGYYLVEESPQFAHTDFDGIGISHGIESGEFGVLILNGTDSNSLNAGDKIVPESAEAVTNNLVLDSTPDSAHISPTDAGSDILLDGIDSSATLAGQSIELEDSLSDRVTRIGLQPVVNTATLINESGGTQQLETSGTSGANQDVGLVSFVTTKINIPLSTPRHLINGLITLATNPFTGHADGGGIDLEIGTGAGVLLIDGWHQVNVKGACDRITSVGDEFMLEDGANNNHLSGFTLKQFGNYSNETVFLVLNGTTGAAANEGDNIILNGTDSNSLNADYNIEGESIFNYYPIEDIIRPSLVVMDSGEFDFGSKGGSTPVDHVAILLEGEEQGSFKQEDESIVSGTHGDDLLLEDGTSAGIDNKLILEAKRIQLEDNTNIGTIPFQNYTNSTIEPFTRPADIESRDSGSMRLEDGLAFGAVLLNGTDGSSTNAGGEFFLESGTYEDFVKNN